jgi:hypothetical protein
MTPPPSTDPPALAWRLGHAGLAPFVLGAALTWLVRPDAHPYVTQALAAYAALILSFLGGIHWGLAMHASLPAAPAPADAQPQPALAPLALAWGVVPSLLAWPALLMPPAAGLVLLGALLLVCYAVDRQLYPPQGAAHWLHLRFRLSAVASLSCFIAAAGS